MNRVFFRGRAQRLVSVFLTLLLAALPLAAQVEPAPKPADPQAATESSAPAQTLFRLKREEVVGGAELLTVFGSLRGVARRAADENAQTETDADDVPLVSILRDTLGDADPENDRLRHVWVHTYTKPTRTQQLASAVPFLYKRTGNKRRANSGAVPPPVLDLASPDRDVWQRFLWTAAQTVFFDTYGALAKTSVRTFRRNQNDHRKAHVIRALAVLSLYEAESGAPPAFSPVEMHEIQARLMLTEKTFGGVVDDGYLQRVYQRDVTTWRDLRGHNWELLRQRAEEEGLYFEPLTLPDGSATHALLWVARTDLEAPRAKKFGDRFLNIKSPWRDKRLTNWKGYTETRYLDAEHRPVEASAPGARAVEFIPLALYGLEHPKIPMLLVDFRDGGNPKRREMSRRLLEDIGRNILSISPFGDLHYFLGRSVYEYVTNRRGMDLNQPSRLRAYSQLKLLLALDASLDPALREDIERRVERVSMNPRENDLDAEVRLARAQYDALSAYARRADGLSARLERDRRAELVPLAHGRAARVLFRMGTLLSLGAYRHREGGAAQARLEKLDSSRRLAYHRRFLNEVARSSPLVEVAWDVEDVRRSLRYVAEHGAEADAKTAKAAARLFERTRDPETRRLCLESLYRIN
ncbi:MAG TPA: hypothetical protein VGV38_01070, partial [Pyrinomonadaceae bacterium]|nr:hypothetical protein [Pyrinomonadaceae bacterium]